MTKENWIRHIEEVTGIKRPLFTNSSYPFLKIEAFKRVVKKHQEDDPECPNCRKRRATRMEEMWNRQKKIVMKYRKSLKNK